jgi:DNA-binding NarL/FixJ family response regulator
MSDASTEDSPGSVIRVMIVDDHEMFGASLGLVLDSEPDMQVVGIAATCQAAVAMARSLEPNVILLDQRLPDGTGVGLIEPLLALPGTAHIVILTAITSDHILLEAVEAGASGFIEKTQRLDDVVAGIRSVAAGETLVSPKMLARLLPRLRHRGLPSVTELTERERQVLGYMSEGMSNADIARTVTLSVHTIRNHVANISTKLGAHSKLEAVAIGVREGLVTR